MMNRREFINSTILTGAALTLSCMDLKNPACRPGTTLIGIGGAGIGLLDKTKTAYKEKLNYIGIDTKGDWNVREHNSIDFNYQRPYRYYLPKHPIVAFAEDDESIEQDWVINYSLLEPVFEIKGKVIVLASLFKTMGGIISHKIIREIIKRKNADVVYFAIGPFSFEGKKAGLDEEYSRVYETGSLCSRFEILSNKELLKPYNGFLEECFKRVDQKIVQRIGQLI